jgi:hypothetical protein
MLCALISIFIVGLVYDILQICRSSKKQKKIILWLFNYTGKKDHYHIITNLFGSMEF